MGNPLNPTLEMSAVDADVNGSPSSLRAQAGLIASDITARDGQFTNRYGIRALLLLIEEARNGIHSSNAAYYKLFRRL